MGESTSYNETNAATQQVPGGIAHETGELHRLLVESVEDYAIFALDTKGYVLSWNAGAQRFKGYTAQEIIGKHFSVFYPPEKVAAGFPDFELREAARVGRFEDEGWRIRKDGTRFWANVVITSLHDSSGRLVGYAKVTRDLSERRAAEEELRSSEERLRLIVEGVRDYAIFMLDPTGHVTTWNTGAQRIKGYTPDEIIGKHFSLFYPKEDIANGKPARVLDIAAVKGTYEEEGWRVRKDGSRFWASVLITALRRPNGELAGFAKVTRDLTERREAQRRALEDASRVAAEEAGRHEAEANRVYTERLQRVTAVLAGAHTMSEVIAAVLNHGFAAACADAGALGLVVEGGRVQVIASAGLESLPQWTPGDEGDVSIPVRKAVRSSEKLILRNRAERDARFPDVAELLAPFEATVALPLEARGQRVGAISMHFRRADALGDRALQFVEAFGQQTAQAVERAMLYHAEQQARAKADEANRAKSTFLASMSHELRTPLNAIGGYADLIEMGLRGPITEEQRGALQRIKKSQMHLLGIINDILNFSRVEAGQIRFELSSLVLRDVLDTVGTMIAPQAEAKGLELVTGDCPTDLTAWADRAKVDQILLNLASNAVKFTVQGKVSLTCRDADPEHVAIQVHDTGSGIPEDQLEKIFEPFVQVGRTLTNSREGTGLGLAISQDLARGMGGEIRVKSVVGEGSVFTLMLPRVAG